MSFQAGYTERHPAEKAQRYPLQIKLRDRAPVWLNRLSPPAPLPPLPALVCIHTMCIFSFVAQFHLYVCDSLPLSLGLGNFFGVFRIQPKCHLLVKPFKTLHRLRLDTLPRGFIPPCALPKLPFCIVTAYLLVSQFYWVLAQRAGIHLCITGTDFGPITEQIL